ncbi:hypothetical protein PR048_013372 [Dryococelus australis]|uniref:Uncharacterized protein n=1 Tax=Dryococelus australis TaxID=614101 RepID=A0ABQ9HS20_9NEOP|nr:hypothetical protein PR048_013372 [Dryococelus australis]
MHCLQGKVQIEEILPPPKTLHSLLTGDHPKSKEFLHNICRYNNAFQITSFRMETEQGEQIIEDSRLSDSETDDYEVDKDYKSKQDLTTVQHGRKCVRHQNNWLCNVHKLKLSAREEYISEKSKVVAAKAMKPPCSCYEKCYKRWSKEKGRKFSNHTGMGKKICINKRFHLSFKPPEVDTCDTSDSFQAKLKDGNLGETEKNMLKVDYKSHLEESKRRYNLKNKDIKMSKTTLTHKVLTGDL